MTEGVFVTQGSGKGRTLGLVTMVTHRLEGHRPTVQHPKIFFSFLISIILIKCFVILQCCMDVNVVIVLKQISIRAIEDLDQENCLSNLGLSLFGGLKYGIKCPHRLWLRGRSTTRVCR